MILEVKVDEKRQVMKISGDVLGEVNIFKYLEPSVPKNRLI